MSEPTKLLLVGHCRRCRYVVSVESPDAVAAVNAMVASHLTFGTHTCSDQAVGIVEWCGTSAPPREEPAK